MSKDLLAMRLCGPRGVRLRVFDEFPSRTRLNILLLTSVTHGNAPLMYTVKSGKNDQWTFFTFVLDCVRAGYIGRGDVLIIDNASIHHGLDMRPYLDDVLQFVGAYLIYLPTYSPELNPCEFVFAQLKNSLYRNLAGGAQFIQRLVLALQQVSQRDMLNFYHHCTSMYYKKMAGDD